MTQPFTRHANTGATNLPKYCSEPNKVSRKTEPVSTSTYQPRIKFSISVPRMSACLLGTGSGSCTLDGQENARQGKRHQEAPGRP